MAPAARRATLIAAIVASAMGFIDGTAVNVALPVMQREMHASAREIQWVADGYLLFLSALVLIGGALGDRYGRRRIFEIGTIVFAASSLVCALVPSATLLIAARCVQGIGGALMIPGSLALITAAYPQEERGRAIGTWSAASAMTTAAAPLLGGWLTQAVTWRAVFLINLPLALAVIVLSALRVKESRAPEEICEPDVLGSACITLALGALLYGILQSNVLAIAAGCVLLAAFVVIELRVRVPIVPPSLFRSRTFTLANVYTLTMYAALSGGMFLIPFDLIVARGYSPAAAGSALLPFVIPLSLFSRYAGALAGKIGSRTMLVAGAAVAGCGFYLFSLLGGANYWYGVFPAALVLGIGATLFVAPLTTSVMNSAPGELAGAASGINNAVARAAGMFAIAAIGLIAHALLARAGTSAEAAAFARAMQISAVLAWCSGVVALFLQGMYRTDERQTARA